jgi:hypothetical protein
VQIGTGAMAALLGAVAWPCQATAAENDYVGLLRARDLTTFGFLRLDMRPSHAIHAPKGRPRDPQDLTGRGVRPAARWR